MMASFTVGDAERIARLLADGRRFFRNGDGYKTFCPLCRSATARRRPRPTLSLAARCGQILVHCHRCQCDGVEIIRELVRRQLLPDLFRQSSAAFTQVNKVRAALRKEAWQGTAGATALAVIETLCKIVALSRKVEFAASVREVAEGAQISLSTAWRALRRLVSSGWLERVDNADGERATIWRLCVPERATDREETIKPARKEGDRLFPSDPFVDWGDRADSFRPVPCYPHEVFRWGKGLGGIKGRIYGFLAKPQTASQIATLMNYKHVRNARLHLRQLEEEGLVRRRSDGSYERRDENLDEVADRRGVLGSNERQRTLHAEQRSIFRRWSEALQHWKRTGEVIDPDNGAVLSSGSRPKTAAGMASLRREVLSYRMSATQSAAVVENNPQCQSDIDLEHSRRSYLEEEALAC